MGTKRQRVGRMIAGGAFLLALIGGLGCRAANDAENALPDLMIRKAGTGTFQQLQQVTLVRIEPDGLVVSHSAGISKIPSASLPPELQRKYGLLNAAPSQSTAGDPAAPAAPAIPPSPGMAAIPSQSPPAASGQPSQPPIKLWTKEDIKLVWSRQSDPRNVSGLDPDVKRKRAVMAEHLADIQSGKLDHKADEEAHKANAIALRAAGLTAEAERETSAAIAAAARANTQAANEAHLQAEEMRRASEAAQRREERRRLTTPPP